MSAPTQEPIYVCTLFATVIVFPCMRTNISSRRGRTIGWEAWREKEKRGYSQSLLLFERDCVQCSFNVVCFGSALGHKTCDRYHHEHSNTTHAKLCSCTARAAWATASQELASMLQFSGCTQIYIYIYIQCVPFRKYTTRSCPRNR